MNEKEQETVPRGMRRSQSAKNSVRIEKSKKIFREKLMQLRNEQGRYY